MPSKFHGQQRRRYNPKLLSWYQYRQRAKAYLARNPYCEECARAGRSTMADEIDHVTPLGAGGLDDLDNLQSLCKPCHREKSYAFRQKQIKFPNIKGCNPDGIPHFRLKIKERDDQA